MKTQRWVAASVAGLVLSLGMSTSYAQDPPFDPAIDLQLFEYAVGPRTFLTVSDADVSNKNQISADFLITFLTSPFTIYTLDGMDGEIVGEARSKVVSNLVAGELNAAYGLSSKMQVGVALPLILSMSGDGLDPTTAEPDPMNGIQASGLGDLRAEFKMKLWEHDSGLRAGALGALTLPTSFGAGGNEFFGRRLAIPATQGAGAMVERQAQRRCQPGLGGSQTA